MERNIVVAPSVLSADFSDIRGAVNQIKQSRAPWVHLDVMDGVFVPSITFGPKFIKDLRPWSDLFFDAHLMIVHPEKYVDEFVSAGCEAITVHYEACENNLSEVLEKIREKGCKTGVSICPGTDVSVLKPYLDQVDIVLVMGVNPGFGGQKLIESTLDKVRALCEMRGDRKYVISFDGGVNSQTIGSVAASGVDVVVTGSAFFKASDKASFVADISRGQG